MVTWTPPFADGWYPRLSPDGRYLLCGNAIARVVEIATKQARIVGGIRYISQGWFNPTQALVANDNGLYRIDAPFLSAPVKVGPSLNFIGVGGNVWAGGNTKAIWQGDAAGHAVRIADGYAATVDETGTVVYAIDVHTAPKLVVWRSGQILRTIVTPHAQNRFRCGAGGYVGHGYFGPSWLNTPDNTEVEVTVTPDRLESPPLPFRHRGQVWLATTGDRGVYLRPLGVRDRAITIPTPAIDCSVVSTGDAFLVASQDAKGRLTLTTLPAETALLPVEGPPIPAIGRPCWMGFVNFIPADTPGNCRLNVSDMIVRDARGAAVALFVEGTPDGELGAINRAIAEAQSSGLPIVAYWPRGLQQGPLPTGADVIGVEAYCGKDESLIAFETRVRTAVGRAPTVALIAQCYTNNPSLTTSLAALVPVYARIARDMPNVWGILAFSGSGRATGLQDHADVRPLWSQLAAGIPSAPPLEEFMEPWKVAGDKFKYDGAIERGKPFSAKTPIGNGVEIAFEKDATDGIHFSVWKDGKLQDRSSSPRRVEVRG